MEKGKDTGVTLHGRPVKYGDMLFHVPSGEFCEVSSGGFFDRPWIKPASVRDYAYELAWDEPPRIDVSKIPPPLFFCEGAPVRVGSIMYHILREVAVEVVGMNAHGVFRVRLPVTGNIVDEVAFFLSFDFPNTPPEPQKVEQTRVRWFNVYENDACRSSYQTFGSKVEAAKHARPGCLGQDCFGYSFTGPLK